MTYQNIKKAFVTDKAIVTEKELRRLVIKVALACLGLCLSVGLASYVVLGFGTAVIVIFLMGAAFNIVFRAVADEEIKFKSFKLFANLWWLSYIMLVAVFFVLKFLRFV